MPRAYFDDFQPDQDWGSNEWTVTEKLCARWVRAGFGDCPADPTEGSTKKRAPASLMFVALSQCIQDLLRDKPPGGVHAKQQLQFHAPIYVGDTLRTNLKVRNKYWRKDRRYVEFDTTTLNQDGVVVATGLRTTIWAG